MPAVYAGVAASLIVAVLAIAYGTAAPTLGVAEFAPAARQALDAPPTTAGGTSQRAGSRRATTTTTAPPASATTQPAGAVGSTAPTSLAARSRSCIGDPPRQTPDPQSPPCVATIFEGDNGGATSTGVSPTEIRVAVAARAPTGRSYYTALFEYFNRYYEFYGRRLVPVFVGDAATTSPASARAAAADTASQSVFAALPGYYMPHASYFGELARHGVVTVFPHGGSMLEDRTLFDALDPYLWTVFPSVEQISRNVASFACTSLAGRPARFAGGNLATATRKFAVVASGPTAPPSTAAIEAAFAECDAKPPIVTFSDATTSESRRVALARLQQDGVTTIACLCHVNGAIDLNRQAAADLGYRPEWLQLSHSSYDELFGGWFAKGAPELQQVLEITPSEKTMPMQARPSFLALLDVDPSYPNPQQYEEDARVLYRALAVLAAGIQGAGPQLTPAAFGAALRSMRFPNPGAGQEPFWQPAVGFGPGDHSFYNDYAVARWSFDLTPYDTGAPADRGSWCYFNRGARFAPGTYPAGYVDQVIQQPLELCR